MADPEKAINSEGNEADVEDTEDIDDSDGDRRYGFSKENNAADLMNVTRIISSGPPLSFPKAPKRLLKCLKNLQFNCALLEAKFYREVHMLECKYANLYEPYYEKRCQVITGKIVPNDEDCDFPSDVETDEEQSEELKTKISSVDDGAKQNTESDTKGIPGFWLTVFRNVDIIADLIQDHDEPILQHLSDVRVRILDNPMGFVLEFHFEPNDYFTDSVLTKEYEMKCAVDESEPFNFDGPEIFRSSGCTIHWNKGMNVTLKTVKKKQKHKQKGSVRTVIKYVPNDSFFNFFSPPAVADIDQIDEDTQMLLSADFEIGHFLRERVIPRAVLFYTGEALVEVDDDDDDDEDDDDGDINDEPDDEFGENN